MCLRTVVGRACLAEKAGLPLSILGSHVPTQESSLSRSSHSEPRGSQGGGGRGGAEVSEGGAWGGKVLVSLGSFPRGPRGELMDSHTARGLEGGLPEQTPHPEATSQVPRGSWKHLTFTQISSYLFFSITALLRPNSHAVQLAQNI